MSPRFAQAVMERMRDRCRRMGLAVWKCDNTGLLLSEPEEPGPLGLLFRSPSFMSLVGGAVRGWADEKAPDVRGLSDGCWGLPIEESHRRRRVGFTVALAFGPGAVEGELVSRACEEAKLDLTATRAALRARARFDGESCAALRESLLWMLHDLGALAEHEQTTAGFTKQLTDSYETIDLLYTLGRSMNDLTQPDAFVGRLCERVRFTLGFGWVGVWAAAEERPGRLAMPSRLFIDGNPPIEKDKVEAGLIDALANASGGRRLILSTFAGQPVPGTGQLLIQPIMRDGAPLAAVIAGDKTGDDPQVSSYDIQLLEAAAGFIGAFLDNSALYAEQRAMFMGTLEALTAAIDAKDRYTCGHSQRVAHLAQNLALAAGLSSEQAERVRIAGLVHDVGKIGVPEAVLCKTGRLSEEEFAAIKLHPEIGHKILRDIPRLEDILPGVLHHHERFDGRGYPHGISGEDIPIFGRLIAIADTFDAMSSTRSYRSAMPRPAVLAELQKSAGTQLDPRLVALFVKLDLGTYDRMVAQHAAAQPPAMRNAA
ncbi:MAG: HD-GYP domain-containing protein [Phycisphaerales bacterium]|nr:HD-GYP domain-containing protein [Phycisphaerales bacterium]